MDFFSRATFDCAREAFKGYMLPKYEKFITYYLFVPQEINEFPKKNLFYVNYIHSKNVCQIMYCSPLIIGKCPYTALKGMEIYANEDLFGIIDYR